MYKPKGKITDKILSQAIDEWKKSSRVTMWEIPDICPRCGEKTDTDYGRCWHCDYGVF